jgi:hypothetical protein
LFFGCFGGFLTLSDLLGFLSSGGLKLAGIGIGKVAVNLLLVFCLLCFWFKG